MTAMACPGAFTTLATVDLRIDFGNADDDYRRLRAEQWCWLYTKGAWLRRIPLNSGLARFEFELGHDAVLFRLQHG